MSSLDIKSVAILVLLGLFLWAVVERPAHAGTDGGGDADRGLIAVTGTYGSGYSALYLIDTKTRHLTAYRLENGRKLEFIAARNCTYDFYLEEFNDDSAPGFSPRQLRRSWKRVSEGVPAEPGKTGASPVDPATPDPGARPGTGPRLIPLGGLTGEAGK
jgi:hypothetical protein